MVSLAGQVLIEFPKHVQYDLPVSWNTMKAIIRREHALQQHYTRDEQDISKEEKGLMKYCMGMYW